MCILAICFISESTLPLTAEYLSQQSATWSNHYREHARQPDNVDDSEALNWRRARAAAAASAKAATGVKAVARARAA